MKATNILRKRVIFDEEPNYEKLTSSVFVFSPSFFGVFFFTIFLSGEVDEEAFLMVDNDFACKHNVYTQDIKKTLKLIFPSG